MWNAQGAYATLAALVACAVAAVILLYRPDRRQNRLLALALVFEAVALAGRTGGIFLTSEARTAFAWQRMNQYALAGFVASYLAFIGTLPSPLAAPLRSRAGRAALVLAVVAAWTHMALRPQDWVVGVTAVEYAPWDGVLGPLWPVLRTAVLLTLAFGFVVAFSAWRRAPSASLARKQAALFLSAFAIRDLVLGYSFAIAPLRALGVDLPALADLFGTGRYFWYPTYVLLFVLFLAYGILKTQLFDVDLKIKWTMKRSTVAAAFVAVFFVASEGATLVLGDQTGSALLGVLAAGLLVFFLAPLQRLADRFADSAMPRVEDTSDYRKRRREDVYRATLEEMLADGSVTLKERKVLLRLQGELGLEAAAANRLETEVMRTMAGA